MQTGTETLIKWASAQWTRKEFDIIRRISLFIDVKWIFCYFHNRSGVADSTHKINNKKKNSKVI